MVSLYRWLLGAGAMLCSVSAVAQNVAINPTGTLPAEVALLDLKDNPDKGLLIPRLALTATNVAAPVTSPATGLLMYNTAKAGAGQYMVTPGFYAWDGSRWTAFGNIVRTPLYFTSTGSVTTSGNNTWAVMPGLQTMQMPLLAGDRVRMVASGTVTTATAGNAVARLRLAVNNGGGFGAISGGGGLITSVDRSSTVIGSATIPTYLGYQSWGFSGYYDVPADGLYTFAVQVARSTGSANVSAGTVGAHSSGLRVEVIRP